MAEVAVHVCGGSVSRLAGVDDDHRAALAPELERGRKSAADPPTTATSQCRSTVRMAWSLMAATLKSRGVNCTLSCWIRKKPEER
jgi:hypothetical protein